MIVPILQSDTMFESYRSIRFLNTFFVLPLLDNEDS